MKWKIACTKIAAGFRDQADLYRSGFVDGDPVLHRHAHEIMIKAAAGRSATFGWT